jgi:hypothetical protein
VRKHDPAESADQLVKPDTRSQDVRVGDLLWMFQVMSTQSMSK